MPFIGFVCDADAPLSALVSQTECLICARGGALPGCQMSPAIVAGIDAGMHRDVQGVSVTQLLGCPRRRKLEAEVEFYISPKSSYWAFRGTMLHQALAGYSAPGVIVEERHYFPDAPHVSGQPDLVDTVRRHLIDYKSTTLPASIKTITCPHCNATLYQARAAYRNKYIGCESCGKEKMIAGELMLETPPQPYEHHTQQVSLYRLLLWENDIEVDTAEIVYLDFQRMLRLPVELLSLEKARELLNARLAAHAVAEPPMLPAGEDWECNYCPVRAACGKEV